MKLLITDNSIRHLYFVLKIIAKFDDVFWIHGYRNRLKYYKIPDHPEMINHFKTLETIEKLYFGIETTAYNHLLLEKKLGTFCDNEINSDEFYQFIYNLNPTSIITYSVPIITSKLLSLNLWAVHAGLLPYYKGSTTNIMPIVHNKPEYIGMTIFEMTDKIDEGKIILQRRPQILTTDNSHTIGCKNTILASQMIIELFERVNSNQSITAINQQEISLEENTYYKKDFNLATLRKINDNIKNGIFEKYKYKHVNIKHRM